jgi:hypothetical protein
MAFAWNSRLIEGRATFRPEEIKAAKKEANEVVMRISVLCFPEFFGSLVIRLSFPRVLPIHKIQVNGLIKWYYNTQLKTRKYYHQQVELMVKG